MARGRRAFVVCVGVGMLGLGCASPPQKPTNVDIDPDPPPATAAAPVASAVAPAEDAVVARPNTQGRRRAYAFPVATLPGFEMLPDGGSRVFVEVTRKVDVEERRAARVLTYVLKGARIVYRNNENPLVTVHFNTPVTQARLLPSGRDLLLSVDLRADTAVTWKMVAGDDGGGMLQLDFPKGSFLPADGVYVPPSSVPPSASPRTGPTGRAWRGKGQGAPSVAAAPAAATAAPTSAPSPGADDPGGAAVPGN
jgi:hypothetical protein